MMEEEKSCSSPLEVVENMAFECTVRIIKNEPNPATVWNFHGCKLCRYKTKSYFIMKSHLRRHRVTRNSKLFNCWASFIERYKCSSCDFKTSILVNFNKHVEISHGKMMEVKVENGENQDDTFVFGNFNLINTAAPLKSYSCDSCVFKTYSKLLYINHYTRCPLNDFINGNSFFRRRNSHKEFLRWHKHHNSPTYMEYGWFQCPKCPYKANRQTTLEGHVKTKHFAPKYRFSKKVKRKPPAVIKVHMCDHCDYTTTRLPNLRNHVISRHTPSDEIVWFKCKQCPYKTKWRQNLYSHVRGVHKGKRFFCEQCPFNAKLKRLLQTHTMAHHSDSTWEEVKTVAQENTRIPVSPSNDAWETDETEKSPLLKCPECRFVTQYKISFLNHVFYKHHRIENKNMKKCQNCNYWSVNEAKMKKHQLYCLKPLKLYECSQCDFKCARSRDLRGHMEKHGVQVQTLRCEICEFKSMQVGDLQRHILDVHVAKETVVCYSCRLCKFKTIEEEELKEHVFKVHIDPQNTNWFYCEMCTYKCRQQSELKSHVLEKHIL